jgi:hypothetical protein
MRISILLFIMLVAFGLCACGGPESTSTNTAAPVTPLANSTVTPYQQPTANKRASASPTPCVGTYVVPGTNGSPDEIHPCSVLDTGNSNSSKLVNTVRPANVNKNGKGKTTAPPAATDSIDDH